VHTPCRVRGTGMWMIGPPSCRSTTIYDNIQQYTTIYDNIRQYTAIYVYLYEGDEVWILTRNKPTMHHFVIRRHARARPYARWLQHGGLFCCTASISRDTADVSLESLLDLSWISLGSLLDLSWISLDTHCTVPIGNNVSSA
jgi:hypothetical protein